MHGGSGEGVVLLGVVLLGVVVGWASHTNERADPSVWIDPSPPEERCVYQPDPCVEALRGAMEAMEPFVTQSVRWDGPFAESRQLFTAEGVRMWQDARRLWDETWVQCGGR